MARTNEYGEIIPDSTAPAPANRSAGIHQPAAAPTNAYGELINVRPAPVPPAPTVTPNPRIPLIIPLLLVFACAIAGYIGLNAGRQNARPSSSGAFQEQQAAPAAVPFDNSASQMVVATAAASRDRVPVVSPTQPPALAGRRGTQLFFDDFSGRDGGWESYFSSSAGRNGYGDGGYFFAVDRATTMYDLSLLQTYGNVVIDAELSVLSGSGEVGLLIGYNGSATDYESASFYRAVIHTSGAPRLYRHNRGSIQSLALQRASAASSQLSGGSSVRLSIVVSADGVDFFRDGVWIGGSAAASPGSGHIGMVVSSSSASQTMNVVFDRLTYSTVR